MSSGSMSIYLAPDSTAHSGVLKCGSGRTCRRVCRGVRVVRAVTTSFIDIVAGVGARVSPFLFASVFLMVIWAARGLASSEKEAGQGRRRRRRDGQHHNGFKCEVARRDGGRL